MTYGKFKYQNEVYEYRTNGSITEIKDFVTPKTGKWYVSSIPEGAELLKGAEETYRDKLVNK